MQFLLFKEEKFYALCTLKDKNFALKQNERDCPMTPHISGQTVLSSFRAKLSASEMKKSCENMKCNLE